MENTSPVERLSAPAEAEAYDDVDVDFALSRSTQDGSGFGDEGESVLPESDFDGVAAEDEEDAL